jgi:predicted nucleic acid-binding protein
MTVHLDTSVLIASLATPAATRALDEPVTRGDRLMISSIVLYEWLRGAHSSEQLHAVASLFSLPSIVAFGPDEARTAARVYRAVARARARHADIAIAACAIEHGAALWTLNRADFDDIPGLLLYPVS